MTLISIDVEADGPIPGKYSMVSFGAVIVEPGLTRTFYGKVKPISDIWVPESLAVSRTTRETHLTYDEPKEVMERFAKWVEDNMDKWATAVSDNIAFDWQFINYYFHMYLGYNPLGFSGRRIGDLYCGMEKDGSVNSKWKKLYRKTPHDHNPLNDAIGNAEALLEFEKLGFKKLIG